MLDRDLSHLHPDFRHRVVSVQSQLRKESVPLRLYEGSRHPHRQALLYQRGRFGDAGKTVTRARPWSSFHNYGVAADFVAWNGVKWAWPAADDGVWKVLHDIGRKHGLIALSFERPHLQLESLGLDDLIAGRIPPGDDSWSDHLHSYAEPGPPPPGIRAEAWAFPPAWLTQERPELDDVV